nr:AMP-binding protein [Mesorhizobium sp. WSM4875]
MDMAQTASGEISAEQQCALPALIDRRSEESPGRLFMLFDDGDCWTYSEAQKICRSTAAALADLGVCAGDRVLVWLPNGPDIVRISIALGYLGAVFVPINLALRGGVLNHIIVNSGARIIIAHQELASRLDPAVLGELDTLVAFGPMKDPIGSLRLLDQSAIAADPLRSLSSPYSAEPWTIHSIFYTSGTTGPSKGVLCSHRHTYQMSMRSFRYLNAGDRILCSLPYFHIAAALTPYAVAAHGASMALISEFRTSEFWDKVRGTQSTTALIMGVMANFLLNQAPSPGDRRHTLKYVLQQPMTRSPLAFAERFGVNVYTQWDMTEMPPPIVSEVIDASSSRQKGYCGRILPGSEVRIVDSADREVAVGEVGELIVRTHEAWVITPGYHNMPEASWKAWRNGWFHTGDTFRADPEGNYYFVDRVKDSIRRRGENISSIEVETEVLGFEGIQAAAAIAASSEHGEQEVLVVVEPKKGSRVDPKVLHEFLVPRMPHFMLPRYIRILERMPRTLTEKIQKNVLREEGVTADTWDRESAGISVRRETVKLA